MQWTWRRERNNLGDRKNAALAQVVELLLTVGHDDSKHMTVEAFQFLKTSALRPEEYKALLCDVEMCLNISRHNAFEKVIALDMKAASISISTEDGKKEKNFLFE